MRYQKRCSSDPEPVGMALMVVGGIICFTIGAACSSVFSWDNCNATSGTTSKLFGRTDSGSSPLRVNCSSPDATSIARHGRTPPAPVALRFPPAVLRRAQRLRAADSLQGDIDDQPFNRHDGLSVGGGRGNRHGYMERRDGDAERAGRQHGAVRAARPHENTKFITVLKEKNGYWHN